tara:strand:- start:24859 stop:27375 length:2517 start_codon:yes stop_codon:yes gene_type:complete
VALKSSVNKLRQHKTSFASGELDPLMTMRSDTTAYDNGAKQLKNVNIFPQGGVYRRPGTKRLVALNGDARLVAFDFDDNEQYIVAFGHQRVDIYYCETNAIVASITGCDWTSSTIYKLNIAQSGDTMIICYPTMATQVLTRTGLTTFTVSNFTFDGDDENVYQPYYKFAAATTTLTVNATSGTGATVTASASHFTSDMVNTYIKINNTSLKITAVASATSATATIFGTLEKQLIENAFTTANGSKLIVVKDPAHGLADGASIVVSGSNAIAGITTGVINTTHTITVNNQDEYEFTVGGSDNANLTTAGGGPLIRVTSANQAHTEWKEQSFSTDRGYPASVTFHDGRLWFGGSTSQPDWLWSSKVDQYFNFDTGEGLDDESIQSSIGMDRVADIRHLISNRHLQVFTANAEFYCPQSETSVLTPENFNIRRQTTYGSNFVNAKAFDGGTIFVQKSGRTVRELLFTDTELAYSANSLSLLSTHLIQTPVDLAVFGGSDNRPEQYALFVNSDGTIANFHSVRTEKIAGWTQWESTKQKATCTITVSDYANIATGSKITLTKDDGTVITFTSTTGTASTDEFKTETSNNATATNLKNTINGHSDFSATVSSAVVTVTRNDVGKNNLTVTSTDTTRLTLTDFIDGIASFKSAEAIGSRCFFVVYREGTYYLEELGEEANTLDHSTTKTITSSGLVFTGLTDYNNKTVKVRSGDYYMGEFTVNGSGQLTLDSGMECLTITVGYDYEVITETMPVEAVLSTGSLRGQPKRISRVIMGLDSSLASSLEGSKIILRQVTDDFSVSPSSFTGLQEFYVLGYAKDRSITITQSDPLPMRVTGLVMEYGY